MAGSAFALILTPHGRLLLVPDESAPALAEALQRRLAAAFARGAGHGLLQLGANEVGIALPPTYSYWREFGARYITAVCATPHLAERSDQDGNAAITVPAPQDLDARVADAPPMQGAEYLSAPVLHALWAELDVAFRSELAQSKQSLQDFLKRRHPAWNLVGRVHFNLAENRKDKDAPFAFIATYTTRLSAHAKAQHLPLAQALREYSDGKSKARLLSLLMPVQRAAEHCDWLRAMVDDGEIFHPLRWGPQEAYRLLVDVPHLEAAGIVVRAPGTWKSGRPARPQVKAAVGGQAPSLLGKEALLDFSMEVTLDGERLSPAEIKEGEIDFVASAPLTEKPLVSEFLFGRAVQVETSSEIVAKKVWPRGAEFTARDIFDLAMVNEKEPDALWKIESVLRERRNVVLHRIGSRDASLRETFAELEVLDYRRSYDECVMLVKRAFEAAESG